MLENILMYDLFRLREYEKSFEEYLEFLKALTPEQLKEIEKKSREEYHVTNPLELLLDLEGYKDYEEFMDDRGFDSVVPAICKACTATYEMEPDCRDGICSTCGAAKVDSIVVLGGYI